MSACGSSTVGNKDESGEGISTTESFCSSNTMRNDCNRDVESFLRNTTPFTDTIKHSGDTNQVECLLAALRETLLAHRWKEANEVLCCLAHHSIWAVKTYTWKCGAEVVFQHSATKQEDTEMFFRKVQTSNYSHCRQKQIEKVFYLLRNNRFEEAYKMIREKTGKAGKKVKWENMLEKEWKKLITAYIGMFEFSLWIKRTQTEHENTEETEQLNKHGKLAINNLTTVLDTPGVWDVFIICYLELMKHFDEDDQDIKSVLVKYNDDNPDNPNSYVYLYQYLQMKESPLQEQLHVLEKLIAKVPSSKFVLDLHKCFNLLGRKQRSKQGEYRKRSITILFNMLDYASWQNTLQPWKLFYDDIIRAAKRNDCDSLDAIDDCWKLRKQWWPQFHFRADQAIFIASFNAQLAKVKAMVAGLFFGQEHEYVKAICEQLPDVKEAIQCGILSGEKRLEGAT